MDHQLWGVTVDRLLVCEGRSMVTNVNDNLSRRGADSGQLLIATAYLANRPAAQRTIAALGHRRHVSPRRLRESFATNQPNLASAAAGARAGRVVPLAESDRGFADSLLCLRNRCCVDGNGTAD